MVKSNKSISKKGIASVQGTFFIDISMDNLY